MISDIVSLFAGVMLVASVWNLYCNDQTYRDRRWLMEVVFGAPDWWQRREYLNAVTYEQHLIHRFFLLDPWRLYPPQMLEGLKREARRGGPA